MFLQNRQHRVWILPATPDDRHPAVPINPGSHVEVDPEHWNTVRKGNRVIDALVTGRHLVPTTEEPIERPHLENTPTPEKPPELTDVPEGVDLNRKSETVTIDLATDTPKRSRKG